MLMMMGPFLTLMRFWRMLRAMALEPVMTVPAFSALLVFRALILWLIV